MVIKFGTLFMIHIKNSILKLIYILQSTINANQLLLQDTKTILSESPTTCPPQSLNVVSI